MLYRHSAIYLLARGVPGLLSLLAIAVFTRLLTPAEYGHYALVIAGVGLGNKLLFEWLRLALLRFLPGFAGERAAFMTTLMAGFLALAVSTGLGVALALLVVTDPTWRRLLAFGLALLWVQALFDMHLEIFRSTLSPARYGAMALTRAVLGLAFGAALVALGLGALGPILGLTLAMALASAHVLWLELRRLRPALLDASLLLRFCRYGAPLSVTAGLSFVIASSDRFMIGWLLDEAAVGRYAVSADLANFAIGLLLMVVNLAAYPLVVRALEGEGPEGARRELSRSLTAIVGVGLPATAGLMLIAPNLAQVLLGAEFQEGAATLIRVMGLAALLREIKAYHFDLAFQLGHYTLGQMWISIAAALLSLALNFWWIPLVGAVGAAYASVVAYGAALLLSAALGRRTFALPMFGRDSLKIALAALGMAAALWPLADLSGAVALLGQVVYGCLVYGLLICWLDAGGARGYAVELLTRWRRRLV